MFKDNLISLRRLNQMTQEDVAEKVGVSRQAVAKWEAGDSIPDLEKSKSLAEIFNVSLDDLVKYEQMDNEGLMPPPKGKYFFGSATVGEKGQIVIPSKARKIFDINPGDQLMILGDDSQGLALVKPDFFLAMADMIRGK